MGRSVTRNEEIVWASALFEGEGYLTFGNNSRHGQWTFGLEMTDDDAVRQFASFVGVGNTLPSYAPAHQALGNKPMTRWTCSRQEDALALAHMMYPYLCARRRAKIDEFIGDMQP
jgi:hypothetical protein